MLVQEYCNLGTLSNLLDANIAVDKRVEKAVFKDSMSRLLQLL